MGRTHWNGVLVKDDVVGESSVVLPGDALASLDGNLGGVENKTTTVSSELDSCSVGCKSQGKGGSRDTCGLGEPAQRPRVTAVTNCLSCRPNALG